MHTEYIRVYIRVYQCNCVHIIMCSGGPKCVYTCVLVIVFAVLRLIGLRRVNVCARGLRLVEVLYHRV